MRTPLIWANAGLAVISAGAAFNAAFDRSWGWMFMLWVMAGACTIAALALANERHNDE